MKNSLNYVSTCLSVVDTRRSVAQTVPLPKILLAGIAWVFALTLDQVPDLPALPAATPLQPASTQGIEALGHPLRQLDVADKKPSKSQQLRGL
jgi:hypothetical protein